MRSIADRDVAEPSSSSVLRRQGAITSDVTGLRERVPPATGAEEHELAQLCRPVFRHACAEEPVLPLTVVDHARDGLDSAARRGLGTVRTATVQASRIQRCSPLPGGEDTSPHTGQPEVHA